MGRAAGFRLRRARALPNRRLTTKDLVDRRGDDFQDRIAQVLIKKWPPGSMRGVPSCRSNTSISAASESWPIGGSSGLSRGEHLAEMKR